MRTPTEQAWHGQWQRLLGQLQEFWGFLTEDDLKRTGGGEEQLVGLIQARTGQPQEAIRKRLSELARH